MPVLPPDRAMAAKASTSALDRRSLLLGGVGALGLAGIGRVAPARAWTPNRSIHVLIGYPAGGAADIVVRIAGEGVRRTSGTVLVGEVRSGAYGFIAAQAVSAAPPDGYALCTAIMGMMSVVPAIPGAKMPINIDRDLTPVTNLAGSVMAVVARPDAPFDDIDGMIAYARRGGATYASSGPGSINHLGAAYIAREVGVEMLHVPYRGGAPATMDIVAGRVDIMVANVAEVAPMIREGKMKALGVTALTPSPMVPKAPPLAQRFPRLEVNNWFGLAGPPNMPADVVEGLGALFAAALREPQTQQTLAERGLEPVIVSGAAFAEQIQRDRARWAEVAKGANIRLD
jgi:tripartite-type tricarboxylate transporter receptor subunit TctC